MKRQKIIDNFNNQYLGQAANLFELNPTDLELHPDHIGCQNIVYLTRAPDQGRVLRISYREDRTLEQIIGEVEFVNHLFNGGAPVAPVYPSINGDYVEVINGRLSNYRISCFQKGKGTRVPDNQYRYIPGEPIERYYRDWGRTLGLIHQLAREYSPSKPAYQRSLWVDFLDMTRLEAIAQAGFSKTAIQMENWLNALAQHSPTKENHGLIHADFNDGNFTLDYKTGEFTVFDFDDCCRHFYLYDLGCTWESGMGRTMFEKNVRKRKDFMENYSSIIIDGYTQHAVFPDAWFEYLAFFTKLSLMESVFSLVRHRIENRLPVDRTGHLGYYLTCAEEDLPFYGFFSPLYDAEHPFSI